MRSRHSNKSNLDLQNELLYASSSLLSIRSDIYVDSRWSLLVSQMRCPSVFFRSQLSCLYYVAAPRLNVCCCFNQTICARNIVLSLLSSLPTTISTTKDPYHGHHFIFDLRPHTTNEEKSATGPMAMFSGFERGEAWDTSSPFDRSNLWTRLMHYTF